MKISKILITCFVFIGIFMFVNCKNNNMAQKKIEYTCNPNLDFIKDGYKGNIVIDGIYCNGKSKDKAPIGKVIKWKLSPNPQREEKKKDTFLLKVAKDNSFIQNQKDFIMWLGHSSFLMRISGVTYITDPIFSDLPTSKRKTINPYDFKTLGKIDYILISHAHFDHFDLPTLKGLVAQNPKVQILGPLGFNKLLKGTEFKSIKTQEAGWFQIFKADTINEIVFLPAKHWHRRGLTDFNKILWGGFGIRSTNFKIYFAGDVAKDLNFFRQINEIYNDFDVCLIPIGSYSPQFLMKEEHVNPKEALEAFSILNGKYFIPMHYGTYDLSDEPLGEPIKLLRQIAKKNNQDNKLIELAIGKTMFLDNLIK